MKRPEWDEFREKDQRLCVLRVLAECEGYMSNEGSLQLALETFGHVLSRAAMRGILHYLHDHHLASVEIVAQGSVYIATIRPLGLDVAAGRETHPGVKRPAPK